MTNVPALPLDHVGVACRDLDSAAAPYERLGYVRGVVEEVPAHGVRLVFLVAASESAAAARIELLTPAAPGHGPIARFLEKRGAGVHHLAFRVPGLERALERLRGEGFVPVEEKGAGGPIRTGAGGRRVAFLQPSAFGGVLVELLEGQ